MKKRCAGFTAFTLIILLFTSNSPAQIEETLKRYTQNNGKGYLQPLVDGLGTSMNRGWYQTAHIPKIGLRLRLSITVMMAPVLDEDKTFTATTEGIFTPVQTATVPTIVGSEKSVDVFGTGGSLFAFPGGFDMNMTGFAVPQLTIGSFLGTSATVRFFSAELGDTELGNIELAGYGLNHSLSQYIPLFPFSVSVGAFWQNVNVGNGLVEFTTAHYGLQASKGFGLFQIYGGAGYDKTDATIDYQFTDGVQTYNLDYEMEGDNGLEMTIGAGFNLFILRVYGDFSFGKRSVYTAGLSLGI